MSQSPNLRARVHQYLRERRRLGFELRSMGHALRSFTAFAGNRGPLTVELMAEWARRDRPGSSDPRTWARRLKLLRPFLRWFQQFEPRTEVPHDAIFGRIGGRTAPHILSEQEISDLLAAARQIGPCDLPSRLRSGATTGQRCRPQERNPHGAADQVREIAPSADAPERNPGPAPIPPLARSADRSDR